MPGTTSLFEDELTTVLTRIEVVLNSQLLTSNLYAEPVSGNSLRERAKYREEVAD